MKFNVGDQVSVNTSRLSNPAIGLVVAATTAPHGPIYNIELQDYPHIDELKGVSEDSITLLVKESEEKPSLKMTLALEETLKEIAYHLNDNRMRLIENVVKHDYYEKECKHYISLNIVLKENE